MAHVSKDVQSVVKLVENCHSRVENCRSQIVSLQDSTLTSIQREQSTARLQRALADGGFTYRFGSSGGMTFRFKSLHVQDSGVISDISPVGPYPIQLSVGENVSVAFEPRDISKIDHWQSMRLNNARFASLSKGSSFDFNGLLVSCDYYPNRPGDFFSLRVDSEFRARSVADWLRKQLWDGLPSGLDFIPKKR